MYVYIYIFIHLYIYIYILYGQKNKEADKLATKHEAYLKHKAEWQVKTDARKLAVAEWDRLWATNPDWKLMMPPRPRFLRFVHLNKSYVNKNHSLGQHLV